MTNLVAHLMILLQSVAIFNKVHGQTYNDTMEIFKDKMASGSYNVDVRPLKNQSRVINVGVSFFLLSIVELNDVSQRFNCNGYLCFFWTDEIIKWKPDNYGGQALIRPQAKNIWKPKVVLGNTLEDRDIFQDDDAPVSVHHNGNASWCPGGTFPTSCLLDLTSYPFDEQTCSIQMASMSFALNEVQFQTLTNEVGTLYFIKKGDWQLVSSSITVFNVTEDIAASFSTFQVSFHLKRNPEGILINILLPVVFLSFLNLWVFVIPVESGEKITYGISVLMALSVFMTIVSEMVPKSSEIMPRIVFYLFILLLICLLTVTTSIVIVFLHHQEVKETQRVQAKTKFKNTFCEIARTRKVIENLNSHPSNKNNSINNKVHQVSPLSSLQDSSLLDKSNGENVEDICKIQVSPNRYKIIGKYIDLVSLIFYTTIWCIVNVTFLTQIRQK